MVSQDECHCHGQVIALSWAINLKECLIECRLFWKCNVLSIEMLNGFLQRIAENEVLGFNDVQSRTPTASTSTVQCNVPPSFVSESNSLLCSRKSPE